MDNTKKQNRKINPIEKANPLSLFTFGYTLGLFKKGFKQELEEDDIYEVVKSCKSKKLGDLSENQWMKATSIMRLLLRRFGIQYLIICLIDILWDEAHTILSPLGLSRLIAYFTPHSDITDNQALGYAGIMVFLKVGGFFVTSNLMVFQTIVGLKIHASLKSLLYRKALKLSPCSSSAVKLGNMITLITKDINLVEHNMWLLKDFTNFFIQFFTTAYLLYRRLGNPAFIGLGMMFVAVPFQAYLSFLLKDMRLKVVQSSDERLQRTQETLSAIKILKMYTWEQFFYERINDSRTKEIKMLMRLFFINIINITIGMLVSKATFLIFILTYTWLGYSTDTELIFYILSLFNQLTMEFSFGLAMNLSRLAQLYVSLSRLNVVLKGEELSPSFDESTEKPSVLLKNVSFKIGNKDLLTGISMNVSAAGLTVVTGPVGSGKSSLLKIILQDYHPVSEGHVEVLGSVSYASQDPWLFPATIRQNILFGEKYDKSRYERVVHVCALKYDFSVLDDGDMTIVADKGMNLSKGQQTRINLARAVYRKTNIYLLDDSLTALDNHVQEFIFNECILGFLSDKICILVSQSPLHIEKAAKVVVLKGSKMLLAGDSKNSDKETVDDITRKINKENDDKTMELAHIDKTKNKLLETEQQQTKQNVYTEVKKSGKVDIGIYKKYVQLGGGFVVISFIMVLYSVSQYCDNTADKLLTKWVDYQQTVFDLTGNTTINESVYDNAVSNKDSTFQMYGLLTLLRCILGVIKFYALLRFCKNASVNLHRAMTKGVIGATMAFFDTHFLGNILNRFSYDLNYIDEFIPFLFPHIVATVFSTVGSIVLISGVNWLFLIPAIVFFILLLIIRWLFIPTSRSLKRLEAATRSPLVGHINSSLEGLTTIRAFRAEQILKDEFDKHQDLYTSVFMTLKISMLGFGFFMNLFSTVFTIIIIAHFLFFDTGTSAGNVGLALSQVFHLTYFVQSAIKTWTDLENNMTSVERAVEYTNLKQEPIDGENMRNWPAKGSISFQNVNLCYEGYKNSVLKGISFSVQPKEKIGIVGRTGAGKSSIITVLYRLYDFEGQIKIGQVDTKTVAIHSLRKQISIIPQDPVLFTGTFRQNIDPFNKYTDAHIWDIIDKVKIKDMVPTLDTMIEDSGAKYSLGQKQLVCLARAAITKRKILVLDEATANMDAETDKMLHSVIDQIFADCTVLTIAHRLHSILNCDKVLVLDKGSVVEYENPKSLMNKKDSLFYKMSREYKMD